MSLPSWRFFAALLLAFAASLARAAGPLEAGPEGRLPLVGHLALHKDPTGRMTAQEAARAAFQALPGNVAEGYGPEVLWLRMDFRLRPGSDRRRLLEVPVAFLEDVRLYAPRPEGGFDERVDGANLARGDAEPRYRNALFPLTLSDRALDPAGETFYLRVASRTSRAVTPVLWTFPAFDLAKQREALLFGAFFGMLLLVAFGNLIYWFFLKERLYLHFAAFVVAVAALCSGTSGLLRTWVDPGQPGRAAFVFHLSNILVIHFSALMFRKVVDLRAIAPRLDAFYGRVTAAVTLAGAAAVLAGRYFAIAPAAGLATTLVLLANLGLSFWLALRRHRLVWLYLLAFGPVAVNALLLLTRNLLPLPSTIGVEAGFYVASLSYMLLMNLPVGYRVFQFRRERDQAREAARRAAEAHGQELELQVALRTQELEAEKAHAEAALVRTNRMVEEQRRFIATVGHEFRTPLAVIDGAAQLVEHAPDRSDPKATDQVRKIRHGVRRLLSLLDQMLSQERLGMGTLALRPMPMDLKACLEEEIVRTRAIHEGRVIRLEDGLGPVRFVGDPDLLALAMRNLMDNALKYSPADSEILVRIRGLDDGRLALSVSDQGIGIPEKDLEQVWDRFFRGPQVARVPGMGIGLDTVSQVVRLHGGEVTVMSRQGEGSTFTVILPRSGCQEGRDSRASGSGAR